jgi:hypothetical protein
MGLLKKEVFLDEFVARLTLALINAPKGFSSGWWVSDEGLSPSERKKAETESDYIFFAILFLLLNSLRETGKIKRLPKTLTNEKFGECVGEILVNSLFITYKYLNNTEEEAKEMAANTIDIMTQYLDEIEGATSDELVKHGLGYLFAERIVGANNPNHSNLSLLGTQFVEKSKKEIGQMLFKVKLTYRPYNEFKDVIYKN